MKLQDTINLMTSEDYKESFKDKYDYLDVKGLEEYLK